MEDTTTLGLPSNFISNYDSNFFINSWNGNASFSVDCYIAEIILINRPVTAMERQGIEAEILWKWGLQALLPVSNPFYNGTLPITISNDQENLNTNSIFKISSI